MPENKDEHFMRAAIDEAMKAFDKQEVPWVPWLYATTL